MRWLFDFVRPHRRRLALVLLLSLGGTAMALAQPYLTKILIDDGLLAGDMRTLLLACGLMLLAALLSTALTGANRWHYVDLSAQILNALRDHVFARLLQRSPHWYARVRTGDLVARIDGDLAEVQRFSVDTLLGGFNACIALAGSLGLMLWLSPELTLIAFLLLPANLLFLHRMRPRVEGMTRRVRERSSDMSSFLIERLGAVRLIQSSVAEPRERERLGELQERFRRDTRSLQMVNFFTAAVPGLLTGASTAVVFVAGGWLTLQGQLSVGTLIAFSAYLARANGPLQTLLGLYLATQRARVSLERVGEIAHRAPEVAEPTQPKALPERGGALSLRAVHYAYPGGPAVLAGVDLELPAGSKLVLGGASGAGKSTLFDLLLRHQDPHAGAIRLDGIDLRELSLAELRGEVALVAQDAPLLPGSIADNIRYACPEASDELLFAAARLARVDEFARALPQGYDTSVGTRGSALSGGQRQRIAIARALLQQPRLLLLDEATAAVDAATEAEIVTAIDQLFAGRSRVLITHRPQSAGAAELHAELRDGRLQLLGAEECSACPR